MDCTINIGNYIREVRKDRGMSQRELAEKCGIRDSVLSLYERGKKIPNLVTISTIAEALNVSIDRLYYGDENNKFITSVADDGRKIVNSIYLLWQKGVLFANSLYDSKECGEIYNGYNGSVMLSRHSQTIVWLLNRLTEYTQKKETFPDPEAYIEMILSSAANAINATINDSEQLKKQPQLSVGSSVKIQKE